MTPDLAELKYQVHAARVALDYQRKTQRPERGGSREEQIANAQARLDAAQKAYRDAQPEPVSLRPRSPYFIGPRRKMGKRGDGPTIKCFRCEQIKPREHFYERGTLCIECIVKRSAEWAKENRESYLRSARGYTKRNRIKIRDKARKAYWRDVEKSRAKSREKYKRNRRQKCEYQKLYLKRRKKSDPRFRALINCRRRIYILLKSAGVKKKTRSAELIGKDRKGLMDYISSLFLPGMSWDNYGKGPGKWVIDHIIPARYFDHSKIEEQKRCWNYRNLKPIWDKDNCAKSDRLPCGSRARDKIILDRVVNPPMAVGVEKS